MGGTTDVDTCSRIVLLCGSGTTGCHGWVERFREQAYEQGWLVRRWQECSEIPIQHAVYGLVCLLDSGEVVSPTTGAVGEGWVPQPMGRPAQEVWDDEPAVDVDFDAW
jgi:hypothetical protein